MGQEIDVFVSSEVMEETGIARLVKKAGRTEIVACLKRIKETVTGMSNKASSFRHDCLYLYDTNAAEIMGYDGWAPLFMEFTGLTVTENTFYKLVRWAEWECTLGGDDAPMQLASTEVKAVSKLKRQYGIDLVKDAHERLTRTKADPSSRLTLDKQYDTNLRKFIEMKLRALPTADPRRKMLEPKEAPRKEMPAPALKPYQQEIVDAVKEGRIQPPSISSYSAPPDDEFEEEKSVQAEEPEEDEDDDDNYMALPREEKAFAATVCLSPESLKQLEVFRRYLKDETLTMSGVCEAVIDGYYKIRKERLAKYEE